jgi:hypothetical protein
MLKYNITSGTHESSASFSLWGLFRANNKRIHSFLIFCRGLCLPVLLYQPLCMSHITSPHCWSDLKIAKTPSLCFVVNAEKQTYKPVPMNPATSFSQLPFQTHFDQCCYSNIFPLGTKQVQKSRYGSRCKLSAHPLQSIHQF